MEWGLSQHSLPALTEAVFLVEVHEDKPDPVTGQAQVTQLECQFAEFLLAPKE
jgi:hypothetical protein